MPTVFRNLLSSYSSLKYPILIFDRRLDSAYLPFKAWRKSFKHAFPVYAGENLKALESFPATMKQIITATSGVSRSAVTVVSAGGGSVGDFSGFVASILKRGTDLIHIPSTWLAAMDSAHGGKNALNVGEIKNQIGTFHHPSSVYLTRDLLFTQPRERAIEALGELTKTALISGEKWHKDPLNILLELAQVRDQHEPLQNKLWDLLPTTIKSKSRIVAQDPFDELGIRSSLNLGHTMGHIIEPFFAISHGEAVGRGLLFSLTWSKKLGFLKQSHHKEIIGALEKLYPEEWLKPQKNWNILENDFLKLASHDKKATGIASVNFVFIRKIGHVFNKRVRLSDFFKEAIAQGWVGEK
ncbi:MAG: 3-dehydroquinate synthase family protein [Bdellovibrionota bacterium]